MHDLLFADSKQLDDGSLRSRTRTLALDDTKFLGCLGTPGADRVGADYQLATRLRVSGTPTIYVGRRQADGRVKVIAQLKGAGSLALFAAAIESANAARHGAR
jgi:protein-disulfide isomerase